MLSGYAYFPPVETVITPRFGAAVKSGAHPQRRRQAKYRLGPHVALVYPLPPASPEFVTRQRPRLVAVRGSLAGQRRVPMSGIRPPSFVNPATVVLVPLNVTLVLSPRQSRKPMWLLREPMVVTAAAASFRLLEDGTSKRLLEDGSGFRILE